MNTLTSDSNRTPQRTEVLRDQDKVMEAAMRLLANAGGRLDICAGALSGSQLQGTEAMVQIYLEQAKRGTRMRLIGEIRKEDIGYVRELMKNIEVRSIGRVSSYFGVSDSEYLAVPGGEEFNLAGPVLYSNEEAFVRHHQALFDMLWDRAVPAEVRIEELEKGESLGETRATFSTQEIFDSANRFVDEMKQEALVIVSREGSVKGNLDFFRKLVRRAREAGAKVRILGRFSIEEEEFVNEFQSAGIEVRTLAPGHLTNLALGIYDRKGMGLVQNIYPDARGTDGQSYLTGVISTNNETVAGIANIFDSLWEETELRHSAELMQDILTHDIRNFNQVSMSNAEVLRAKLGKNQELDRYVQSILNATKGSTELIQKTKMLASIMTTPEPPLRSVPLEESIERSMSLVKEAFPNKQIEASSPESPKAMVIADSLLDEVFVNIISNAVKYTVGSKVPLEISIQEAEDQAKTEKPQGRKYWKVAVADHGKGMTNDMKLEAWARYMGASKTGGLGLSIAHALTVNRYSGKINLKDRVEGDYTQGTKVELWLPKA